MKTGPVWIPKAQVLAKYGCPFVPVNFGLVNGEWVCWPLDANNGINRSANDESF